VAVNLPYHSQSLIKPFQVEPRAFIAKCSGFFIARSAERRQRMSKKLTPYGYYYGSEADQFTFYRLPKALFTNDRYKELSDGAKILYGLMLDRMGLSIKNGWLDEQNRVFITFTLEDATEQMNCKNDKGVKMFAELDTVKGVGLIERVRQGQGRPAIIYVRKFLESAEVLTTEKPKSALPVMPKPALPKNRSQDFGKSVANKNDIINIDFSDTDKNDTDNQSIYPAIPEQEPLYGVIDGIDRRSAIEFYRDIIKENIAYEYLCVDYNPERVTEILELILEVACTARKTIRIGDEDYPAEVVKSRFMNLGQFHIEYVIACINKNTTKVYNIRSYLLTTLYNAPATIGHYYTAEVNHDLYGID
jgi:hypothetical protein